MDRHLHHVDTRAVHLLRPVLEEGKAYVIGQGDDAMTLIALGALLELILIIANIGTAVVPYSIHKRQHEAGALA
jgi:hypothetical protein